MRLLILAVGRLKDGPERELFERYRKRLAGAGRPLGWSALDVIEVAEGRSPDPAQRQADESERLLARARGADVKIALDESGRQLGSEALARHVDAQRRAGVRELAFLIGGPDGHGPQALSAADLTLSLGPMTLPHMLARVVLAEQLYRAATMLTGHPYHRG